MNKKLVILLLPLITSCGNNKLNSTTPSMTVEQNKVYFLNSDSTNKTSYLYSFDLNTHNISLEPSATADNTGVNGFQSRDSTGNLQNLYVAEDIHGQPARVTVYNTAGNSKQNTSNLPQNVSDIMLVNNSLYYAGYDKKEIAITDPSLNLVTLQKTTINSFDASVTYDPNNFSALLNQGNNFYAISVGYTPQQSTTSTIYQLSSDFISLPTNHWSVQINGATCYNLNSTIRLSSSKLIASCNPVWEELPAGVQATPSIFSIDISTGTPIVTLLTSGAATSELSLGGLSNDKNYVLVTENDPTNFYNPTILKSYWLNITNSSDQINTNGAFGVTYNANTNTYVFNCIVNSSNQCQSNTIGIAQPLVGSNVPQSPVTSVTLNNFVNLNGVRGINFFKDM